MLKLTLLLSLLTLNFNLLAQACCTSGTPILGSLEMSSGKTGELRLGLTYERNVLRDIYEGVSELVDNTRERMTESVLFELNYGLTRSITITTLFTFVNQSRFIRPLIGAQNHTISRGISDAVALIKYNIINLDMLSQMQLSLGAGIKAPLGKSDVMSNGLLLPADMQPGSGSWDIMLWGYFSQANLAQLPINIYLNISYKLNSTNERFGRGTGGYSFGNEFITNLGLGYRTDTIVDYSLLLRFRNTVPDKFNLSEIPNTGGDWLYIVPGINFKLGGALTTRLSGQIPIFRNLSGTQLTTSYTASVSFYYSFRMFNDILNF